MKLKSAIFPVLVGICSYGIVFVLLKVLNFDFTIQDISILQSAMYVAVAIGLYLNVSEINTSELLKNKVTILSILLIGVPAKILIPGSLLFQFSSLGLGSALLCATVIAQIDPILTACNVDPKRFSEKSGTILRCWSSFDDPITVLFAFYIFLPLFFGTHAGPVGSYFFSLCIELLVCGSIALFLYKLPHDIVDIRSQKIGVAATCLISALLGKFLLPATLGLVTRPFQNEKAKETLLNWTFWFSAAVIGALSVDLDVNWSAGLILGVSTFAIAQPVVSFLFIRGDSPSNFWRIVFGHQNGMTAILLTITIELQTGQTQLMSVTIPAVLFIALLYGLCNWWLDQHWLPESSNKREQKIDVIVYAIKAIIYQITNALAASITKKEQLQIQCVELEAELTKLKNTVQQAANDSPQDVTHRLLVQKRNKENSISDFKHELDSCQDLIILLLQYLNESKTYLLKIREHIIRCNNSTHQKDKINRQIQNDCEEARRLILKAEKVSQGEPGVLTLDMMNLLSDSTFYLSDDNKELGRAASTWIVMIEAQLTHIQAQLQQHKVINT